MARYNKVDLGPAEDNTPQTEEAIAPADTLPGTICKAGGVIAGAVDVEQGIQLYIADLNWCAGGSMDETNVTGDTMIMQRPLQRKHYAALLANGVNMTALDWPLKVGPNGVLTTATVGTDRVQFYGREIYNNASGSAQHVAVRIA